MWKAPPPFGWRSWDPKGGGAFHIDEETCEFPGADGAVCVYVVDRVGGGVDDLAIVVDVEEFEVMPTPATDRVRVGFVDADDAEHIEIRKAHVVTVLEFHGLAFGGLAAFFLEL